MREPPSIISQKLSIFGISYYYDRQPHWNHEYCDFCCLKYQQIFLHNGSILHLIYFGLRDKHRSSTFTAGRRVEDARIQIVQYFIRIYMYFMIWGLQINLLVYHYYLDLDILTHNNLVIDALLELDLEISKIQFSFKSKASRIQHMHQIPGRRWASIYANKRKMLFIEGIFQQKNQLPFSSLTLELIVLGHQEKHL